MFVTSSHLTVLPVDQFLHNISIDDTLRDFRTKAYKKMFRVSPYLTPLHVVLLCIGKTQIQILLDIFERQIRTGVQLLLYIFQSNWPFDDPVIVWILSFRRFAYKTEGVDTASEWTKERVLVDGEKVGVSD